VPIVIMADREHNASPMPGVARNNDPALNIAEEHVHEHVHHSARAAHEDSSHVVYTSGTTDEKVSKLLQPSAQDSHIQHRHHADINANHDIEKNGGFTDYDEKAVTRSSSDREPEVVKKPWYSPSVLYRKFRLPIHIFIGMFFTG
jgi:CNT family concentrative nucleoside transporter